MPLGSKDRVFANRAVRAALAFSLAVAAPAGLQAEPVQQLRIYRVPAENEEVFHRRFRDQAIPIMRGHGFEFVATWRSRHEGQTEFVYLLSWPDEATMAAAWDAFMADERWSEIKRRTAAKHGTFVLGIEDRTLIPTDYSPSSLDGD
ncbi:NIPSNAP family protein [Pelagerythrobacter marensis]|uniref:NIPSNAP family protein n=1 Tax=Pelagerythrobacter marensis TaxID=543877 RepID=A0ABZ2D9E7_9SPHN